MGAVLHQSASISTTVTAGVTRYFVFAQGTIGSNSLTEAQVQFTHVLPGTWSGLYCRITANATSSSSTVKSRINTANGNQTFTIGAAATGEFQDSTNSDSIVNTNLSSIQVINGGGGTLTFSVISGIFNATSNYLSRYTSIANNGYATAGSGHYIAFAGQGPSNTTEGDVQYPASNAGTLQNTQAYVLTNTRVDTSTWRVRKNTANGNQTFTIGSAATGLFQDLSNQDSYVATDLINHAVTLGAGAGTLTVNACTVDNVTTDGTAQFIVQPGAGGTPVNQGVTTYNNVIGGRNQADTTELDYRANVLLPVTLTHLKYYVKSNTVSATSTFQLRVNGSNVNNVLSVGTLATGVFDDTTHSDILVATDECTVQVVVGAGGTSITYQFAGILGQYPTSQIKTINGLAVGSVKTVNGLAIASVKTWDGLA